ncbi:MAG: starch synthase, partial [Rhizobiales bacterium]|nr:starch synthase [Hyphomicrobiales bacterium]
TGIQFNPVSGDALEGAILRIAALWRDRPSWKKLQKNAMKTDVSWTRPAAAYARLYRDLAAAS